MRRHTPLAAAASLTALALAAAGCGGSASDARNKAATDFLTTQGMDGMAANCDATPDPSSGVYPCNIVGGFGFHDHGWYCITFNAQNEVVDFERSYIDGACG